MTASTPNTISNGIAHNARITTNILNNKRLKSITFNFFKKGYSKEYPTYSEKTFMRIRQITLQIYNLFF